MAEFAAHTYLVGGLFTHGGDYDTDYDDQPSGLKVCWDNENGEWREIACTEHGEPCWVPFVDGERQADGRCCDWHGLLKEFGPVWDGVRSPARELEWAWV